MLQLKKIFIFLELASTPCAADLPSYLTESSNFKGGDGISVKVRCVMGKVFNSSSDSEKEVLDCELTSDFPPEDDCIPGAKCKLEDVTK